MKRREFILSCGGLFVMSQLPAGAKTYGDKKLPDGLRNVRKITIPVGATSPFKALQISDSHLTWTDSRDNERKGGRNILAKAQTPDKVNVIEYTITLKITPSSHICLTERNNLLSTH